jgi:hypothetical protein
MLKEKSFRAVILQVALTTLCLLCATIHAQTSNGTSTNFNRANDDALAAAKKELLDAAKVHRVSIQIDRMLSATDGKTTIVHAPITGIERYGHADFAAGAPILLVIVRSTMRLAIPNGSYVIRAQYQSGATSGKATFTDRNGTVSAQRDLIVRTWEQARALFPTAYPNPVPVNIPNITSIHYIIWDQHGNPHYYFDCSGINGTLYFEMG